MSCTLRNGARVAIAGVPVLPMGDFRRGVAAAVAARCSLMALFGAPRHSGGVRLIAVIGRRAEGELELLATEARDAYPALTPDCAPAAAFEREIAEQYGIVPEDHPWLKPVRFQPPEPGGTARRPTPLPGVQDFFTVSGPGVHEVAVGPIHAGIIEPGHFRFQADGEKVLHLEIALGYQHRGVERALVGGPGPRTVHWMETLAGDTTVAHATAYCQAIEALSGCEAPPRAQALRAVMLELERLANHTGSLGGLAQDIGFLPAAAYCGRVRGDFLNLTAALCGSRFGRGMVRPGGVRFDADADLAAACLQRLDSARRDVQGAVRLLFETSAARARLENTGTLSRDVCVQLGMVGPAARASGLDVDARRDFPSGRWRGLPVPVPIAAEGDVYARAQVRWQEVQVSLDLVRRQLEALPPGPVRAELGVAAPEACTVSVVEGWRGEVCHVALTDGGGAFARYKVIDPSFRNWAGLAMALRGQQISDFPLCNKSFDLSYCGHDL
jgi:Ni,Fe-hydrogenase III large subunit